LIEKAQSSDRFVRSQNALRSEQRATLKTSAIAAVAASSMSRIAAIGTSRSECRLPAYIGNRFSIRSEFYFSIQFQLSAQKGYSSGLRRMLSVLAPPPSTA
jgi:hypothetical protein